MLPTAHRQRGRRSSATAAATIAAAASVDAEGQPPGSREEAVRRLRPAELYQNNNCKCFVTPLAAAL